MRWIHLLHSKNKKWTFKMGLKHFQIFNKEDSEDLERLESSKQYKQEVIREGNMLKTLTNAQGFSIIKTIIDELQSEYIEKATIDKDYAPMYGRESLKRLLEIVDGKIEDANSYLNTGDLDS